MIEKIIRLRKTLHRHPCLSGNEGDTAARIIDFLSPHKPDMVITPIAGTGLAAVFTGIDDGPTTVIRCELDALPIDEASTHGHASTVPGVFHACGHDGHMAITAGLAPFLSGKRILRGRAVLLFQPAEETGAGAQSIIADPLFAPIAPDYIFALHNLPGFPLRHVVLRAGTFACASLGMIVRLHGRSAHASNPAQGRSPAPALSSLMIRLPDLPGSLDNFRADPHSMITVIFAEMGKRAMGIAPGEAELRATLRSSTDRGLGELADAAVTLVAETADVERIEWDIDWCDLFPATINNDECIEIIRTASLEQGLSCIDIEYPFRWSEDFGHYTHGTKGAIFGIGGGIGVPGLHDSAYDFPDTLIETGIAIFTGILSRINGLTGLKNPSA